MLSPEIRLFSERLKQEGRMVQRDQLIPSPFRSNNCSKAILIMRNKWIQSLAILLSLTATYVRAQTTETQPRDLFYDEVAVKEREAVPYDYVGESDVYWHKRVWRVIDVHEKMNLPFRYEGLDWKNLSPLITTLRGAALSGETTVFDDESFKNPLTVADVQKRGAGFDTIMLQDFEGNA